MRYLFFLRIFPEFSVDYNRFWVEERLIYFTFEKIEYKVIQSAEEKDRCTGCY